MSGRAEARVTALALALLAIAAGGARMPVPGGRVTVFTEDGEVGDAVRETLVRAATGARVLDGEHTALVRVIAPDSEDLAAAWTLEVDPSVDAVALATALAAESTSRSRPGASPGLFADVAAVNADQTGRPEITLRFSSPVCSPLPRFEAWRPTTLELSGVNAPFLAALSVRFRSNPAWPGPVHLERLDVSQGMPAVPGSGEIRVSVRQGDGRPDGVFLCRVLATLRGDDETRRARTSTLLRLLDRDAFRPLVSPDALCPWFTDVDEPRGRAAADTLDTLRNVTVAIGVARRHGQGADEDPDEPAELSALVARRARVLLESVGGRVVDLRDVSRPDVALTIVSSAFLSFGPAEGDILDGHARGADAAWTVLALGLDIAYGPDVAGAISSPETLWLVGPGPER